MTEDRKQITGNIRRIDDKNSKPFISVFLILISLILSCGKRGDPTLKDFDMPLPASNLNVVHKEDKLIINWSYPSQERTKIKGFYILKKENLKNGFKNIGFIENSESRFIDRDFKTNQEYLYKIVVVNLKGIQSESNVIKATPLPLPEPPSGLSFVIGNEFVTINWNKVNNYKYNIYKSYEKGKYPSIPLNSTPISEPFYDDRMDKEKSVFYTVRSLFNTDIKDEGYPSEELEISPEAFIPSRPINLQYVISEKGVYLLWQENPEMWIKGYNVYGKEEDEKEFKLIGNSITPTFLDKRPLRTKRIYYVTSLGPIKESVPSEKIEIFPIKER
jgi:hypothetical protein